MLVDKACIIDCFAGALLSPMRLPLSFSLTSSCISMSVQTCYYPDGQKDPNGIPCQNTTSADQYSACCGFGAYCLSNGLCFNPDGLMVARSSCTDHLFASDSCGLYCLKCKSQDRTCSIRERFLSRVLPALFYHKQGLKAKADNCAKSQTPLQAHIYGHAEMVLGLATRVRPATSLSQMRGCR